MFSADDHPGIFTFMVGMIVLVMSAVGLSVLVDKRGQHARGANAIRHEIAAQASEISELNARKDRESADLSEQEAKVASIKLLQTESTARTQDSLQTHATLTASVTSLQQDVERLEAEFVRYRVAYRRQVRAAAIGEKLGNLTVRGGRVYVDATVTRVTEIGLEIQHESGMARIQAPDLEAVLQDRFQWSDVARQATLIEESVQSVPPSAIPTPTPPKKPAPGPSEKPKVDPEKLRLARQQVVAWGTKVNSLTSEANTAASYANGGKQTSVPGRLETWAARAERLNREVARARLAQALAKSELEAISPRDPLLRPTPDGF